MVEESQGKTIYLAPSNHILNQVQETIEKARENGEISEEQYKRYKEVKYTTYTSLMELSKMESGYDNIILDEFHRCGAPEWGKGVDRIIQSSPNAKIIGMSATPLRAVDNKDMADELFEGNIASEMTLEEAVAEGIIEAPIYVNGIYSLNEVILQAESKIEKIRDEETKKELRKDIEEAKRHLGEAEGLDDIFAKYADKKEGKYIVFCSDIDDMHKKMQEAYKWFEKVGETRLYEVSYKKSEELNEDTLTRFREEKGKINLLFSVDKLNEGIHVDGIDGVIMLRKTGSPIVYMQQLGRALSAGNEGTPLVFDLVNNIDSSRYVYEFMERVQQIRKERGIEDEKIGSFKIFELQRDVKDILQKINEKLERNTYLEKAYAIKAWMEKNNTTRPPSSRSKNKDEAYYGEKLHQIRKIVNKYKKMETEEEISKYKKKYPYIDDIKKILTDIDKNNLSIHFINLQLVTKWVEEHNWERLPSQKGDTLEEKSLGGKLSDARRNFIELYLKKNKEEKEKYKEDNPEIEETLELIIELYLRCGNSEQKRFAELAKRGEYKKRDNINDTLDILEVLYDNGVKVEKLKLTKTEKGKNRQLQLFELTQEGVDIQKIIKDNSLDEKFILNTGITTMRSYYLSERLSTEQIDRIKNMNLIDLETIGTRKRTKEKLSIEEKAQTLIDFKGKLTDIKSDFITEDGIPIGRYICEVRKKKSNLSREQIKLLDNKDMIWNKKEGQMSLQEKVEILLAFDDLSDTKDLESEINQYKQYIRNNKEKLTDEQMEELKLRGMRFEKAQNVYLRDALLIKEWMERKNTTKPPSTNKKDMEENDLCGRLYRIRTRFIESFEKLETESEKAEFRKKNPEIDEVIEIINKIDKNNIEDISTRTQLKNILKVKQWMKDKNTIIPPYYEASDDKERSLGGALARARDFIETFITLSREDRENFEKDNPEVEYVIKIIHEIDLTRLHAIQEWMRKKDTLQPPTATQKDKEEGNLGKALNELRYRYLDKYLKIVPNVEEYRKMYPAVNEIIQEITKIDEKVKQIQEEKRRAVEEKVPTKLQYAKDVIEWMKKNGRTNPPAESSKDKDEAYYGAKLHRAKKFVNKFRRLKTEEEKAEFRKRYPEIDETLEIVETIEKDYRRVSAHLININEITEWVEEHNWERLPSQKGDTLEEKRLGSKLSDIRRCFCERYLKEDEEGKKEFRIKNPEIDEVMEKIAHLFIKCGNPDRIRLAQLIMEDIQKRQQAKAAKKLESMYEQLEIKNNEQNEGEDIDDDKK